MRLFRNILDGVAILLEGFIEPRPYTRPQLGDRAVDLIRLRNDLNQPLKDAGGVAEKECYRLGHGSLNHSTT